MPAYLIGDLEHDRNSPECLHEAPRAGGLLPDAVKRQWERLVLESGCLAADPELKKHRVSLVDGDAPVGGCTETTAPSGRVRHPAGEAADHLQSFGIDVMHDHLVHLQLSASNQPLDELGGVGGAGSDDGNLHPLTPVSVTPSIKTLCAKKKIMMTGITNISDAVISGRWIRATW